MTDLLNKELRNHFSCRAIVSMDAKDYVGRRRRRRYWWWWWWW